jgi:predicted signal transduction protein with EAL and GGDEF domain
LLRNADLALYAAKADGRGRFRLFERHMDADLQARRTLELDLRQALQGNEFELFYQPIVSVARRTVCGFEALLRWRHPTRGLVPPDRFIPQAEAAGLLVPIGAWVLRHACMEAATWTNGARIAVNLSAVQIVGETLVDTVLAALRDSGLDPRRLELEITETAMLQDTEVTLATLHELKMLGIAIAMDDFGTGYSSLSYLQRFPFDKVKIDRSFTMHLGTQRESAAIVSSVIDLCASLAMRTTAEGVENAAQFEALARIGCTEAQGYYFSRPRPAADIPAMIEHIEGAVSVES